MTTTIPAAPTPAAAATTVQTARTASVTLFKKSGKYYTIQAWRVPADAIGPADMRRSPDSRRVDGGSVLVDADAAVECPDTENWGVPHLFPAEGE